MGQKTLSLKKKLIPYQDELTIQANPVPLLTPKQDVGGQHTNRCYVLIGLPGSGKSTWCNAMLKNWKGIYPALICEDDLIEDECRRSGQSYAEVLSRCDTAEQQRMMKERFHQALGVGRDILIDRLNLTELDRSELLSLLPDQYQKIAIVFTIPNILLFERLENRYNETGRPFSKMVIQNMIKRLERPGQFEFDRVTTIDHTCTYC